MREITVHLNFLFFFPDTTNIPPLPLQSSPRSCPPIYQILKRAWQPWQKLSGDFILPTDIAVGFFSFVSSFRSHSSRGLQCCPLLLCLFLWPTFDFQPYSSGMSSGAVCDGLPVVYLNTRYFNANVPVQTWAIIVLTMVIVSINGCIILLSSFFC